ncbi:MAG: 2-C-methyl-D-erythritol 4-phosphate cytidylyltransferase [Alphaproteobacteria bacterium]
MKNALVILAGGKGTRFHHKIPKQFHEIGNKNMINIILSNIDSQLFNWIVLSISKNYRNLIKKNTEYNKIKDKIIFSEPGKTRQKSSFNALKKINYKNIKNVLIHDGSRPFCSNNLIKKILKENKKGKNVVPFIEYNDRQILKNSTKDIKVINIQTPQAFDYQLILSAHKKLKN